MTRTQALEILATMTSDAHVLDVATYYLPEHITWQEVESAATSARHTRQGIEVGDAAHTILIQLAVMLNA